jgi:hypothetical protein
VLDGLKGYPLLAVSASAEVKCPSRRVKVTLNSVLKDREFAPSDVIEVLMPQHKLTKEEVQTYLSYLPVSNTIIFHSDDIFKLINETRDLLDRKALSSLVNILLNFGNSEISTPAKARRLAYHWDGEDLLRYAGAEANKGQNTMNDVVAALSKGTFEGTGIPADSALYEQANEFKNEELRKAFLTAIAEKMLVIRRFLADGDQRDLADAYAKGKYSFSDQRYEEILGKALLRREQMNEDDREKDARAIGTITENGQGFDAFLVGACNGIDSGNAPPGTVTAVINAIVNDVYTDHAMKKYNGKERNPFNVKTMDAMLGAA